MLDGKVRKTKFTEDDQDRVRLIAKLLEEWGLVELLNDFSVKEVTDVVVISFNEKENWDLRSKYTIGKKSN